ncbi:MAG: hypothetical protein ACRCVT_11360 [Leadbetterella sp.]
MKFKLVTLMALLYTLPSIAQMPKFTFGKPSLEEVSEKFYPLDSSQAMQYICKSADVRFTSNSGKITLTQDYYYRLKFYKKSALDEATITIKLLKNSSDEEVLYRFKGFTHNLENGTIQSEKFDQDLIFKDKSNERMNIVKVSFPNVKEGSVIEYKYSIDTPYEVNSNPRTWYFQESYPTSWNKYIFLHPKYFFFKTIMGGYLSLSNAKTDEYALVNWGGSNTPAMENTFEIKDVPPIRKEPFTSTIENYISKIDFELSYVNIPGYLQKNYTLDFPALNKTLLEHSYFGEALKGNGFFWKEKADELKAKHTDTLALVNAAIEFIQSSMKWNGKMGIWASESLKKQFNKGEADVADINLSLINLLRKANLDVSPVVLGTRSHGFIGHFALIKRLNYVIGHIKIKGKDYFLDACEPLLPMGVLPEECLNYEGWLVSKDGGRKVEIIPNAKKFTYSNFSMDLNPEDGVAKGKVANSYYGYKMLEEKKKYIEKGKDKYQEELLKSMPSVSVSNVEFINTDVKEAGNMQVKYDCEISDAMIFAGSMYYFNPMQSQGITTNPFTQETRKTPIEFPQVQEKVFQATYTLPSGFTATELPESLNLSLPESGGRFLYSAQLSENKIIINSRFLIQKTIFAAEDYDFLKAFYDKIISKHAEQIVIKKI